jgi:Cdc6-like AAA superfamily ATPase
LQEHIDKAWDSIKELKKKYLLEGLSWHHRVIHGIIKEQPGISSGNLRDVYLKLCNQGGKKPIAMRTLSAYLARLIEMKLIASEQVEKRGRSLKIL